MAVDIRPIEASERPEALALWVKVFNVEEAFFRRYFDADPWNHEGDTFGAWDGERLASAVHVCRRPVEWEGEILVCGGIAAVATLEEYRRQGVSRDLLREAIGLMEREGMAFSLLFTGVPHHYAPLGWEQAETPWLAVELSAAPEAEPASAPFAFSDALMRLYHQQPRRPVFFDRPQAYFRDYVGCNYTTRSYRVIDDPAGYAVLSLPTGEDGLPRVMELRAADQAAEASLLSRCAAAAWDAGKRTLELHAPPQFGARALSALGAVRTETAANRMFRNVSMQEARYQRLLDAFRSGGATWWPGDGF